MTFPDISTISLVVTVVILGVQTWILYRQSAIMQKENEILDSQTRAGETVALSVEPMRSTMNPQTVLVNVKNEGKGVAHVPVFDFYLIRQQTVIFTGSQSLQTIGPSSTQDMYVNAPSSVPNDAILRLYWKGTGSDGHPFNGSYEIALSSVKVIDRQL